MFDARKLVVAVMVASSIALAGCAGTPAAPQGDTSSAQEQNADFDGYAVFGGQWRGSVESSGGQTPYGTSNAPEQMLDVYINEDGTCSVEPLEAHKDLLTEEGTWSASDESKVTLALPSGDIVLSTVDDITLEANAADFGIEGFDTMELVLY